MSVAGGGLVKSGGPGFSASHHDGVGLGGFLKREEVLVWIQRGKRRSPLWSSGLVTYVFTYMFPNN